MNKEKKIVRNAIITGASLDIETSLDRVRSLTFRITMSYGGSLVQSFGGFQCYHPKMAKNGNFAGWAIYSILRAAGVEQWSDLKGRSVRVIIDEAELRGSPQALGHIIEDDRWFEPSRWVEAFEASEDLGEEREIEQQLYGKNLL